MRPPGSDGSGSSTSSDSAFLPPGAAEHHALEHQASGAFPGESLDVLELEASFCDVENCRSPECRWPVIRAPAGRWLGPGPGVEAAITSGRGIPSARNFDSVTSSS